MPTALTTFPFFTFLHDFENNFDRTHVQLRLSDVPERDLFSIKRDKHWRVARFPSISPCVYCWVKSGYVKRQKL